MSEESPKYFEATTKWLFCYCNYYLTYDTKCAKALKYGHTVEGRVDEVEQAGDSRLVLHCIYTARYMVCAYVSHYM